MVQFCCTFADKLEMKSCSSWWYEADCYDIDYYFSYICIFPVTGNGKAEYTHQMICLKAKLCSTMYIGTYHSLIL